MLGKGRGAYGLGFEFALHRVKDSYEHLPYSSLGVRHSGSLEASGGREQVPHFGARNLLKYIIDDCLETPRF
jgi:hypothetical protein